MVVNEVYDISSGDQTAKALWLLNEGLKSNNEHSDVLINIKLELVKEYDKIYNNNRLSQWYNSLQNEFTSDLLQKNPKLG